MTRGCLALLSIATVVSVAGRGTSSPAPVASGKIVFASRTDKEPGSHIFIMNADGSGRLQLTRGAQHCDNPRLSPDGRKIAFDYFGSRPGLTSDIYVMNADGSGQICLTKTFEQQPYCADPAFSPDGKRIIFASYDNSEGATSGLNFRPAERGLFVLNLDGPGFVRLTDQADFKPAFSPDGKHIVFESAREEQSRDTNYWNQIFLMDADGSNPIRLARTPWDNQTPVFSPDGKSIAFTSERTGDKEIYVMSTDGSGQTRLTNNPADDEQPAFSPDGRKIAFVSNRDGNNEIYVMNSDGSGQKRLTHNTADDTSPHWQ